jgi:microcystin-dependent protein
MTSFLRLRPARLPWAAAWLACVTAWPAHAGITPFIGELMPFAGNACPGQNSNGAWLPANGQTLSIQTHQALFALLGTTYGGNGVTTFMLPDLRGRQPVGVGQGLGLNNVVLGQSGGVEQHTLLASEMPAHVHGLSATASPASTATPATGLLPAQAQNAGAYAAGPAGGAAPTANAGSGQPFAMRAPYLVVTWCIAMQGVFPSRN